MSNEASPRRKAGPLPDGILRAPPFFSTAVPFLHESHRVLRSSTTGRREDSIRGETRFPSFITYVQRPLVAPVIERPVRTIAALWSGITCELIMSVATAPWTVITIRCPFVPAASGLRLSLLRRADLLQGLEHNLVLFFTHYRAWDVDCSLR